jgi:multidrug efflux pump subunit AcrA (membrane-fusion protein)
MLSALLLAAAPALPASERRGMILAAPRNGCIQAILVKDGQHIDSGSKICELKPDDEDFAIARIEKFKKILALEEQFFSDDQVALRREILTINLGVAKVYLAYAKAKLECEKLAVTAGKAGCYTEPQAWAAEKKAEGEVRKAEINLAQFDFSVKQAKQRFELLQDYIPHETQLVQSKLALLDVVSPIAGRITLNAGVNSFVKVGFAIAEVV